MDIELVFIADKGGWNGIRHIVHGVADRAEQRCIQDRVDGLFVKMCPFGQAAGDEG
jgi:hypothetical protein